MAEANDGHEGSNHSMTERRACHQCDDKKIPWRLAYFVAIAAVVLLVGLPIGTVLIVNLSGCCLTSGPEHIVTFWASMIAGFLTLFGMVVTGVFVLTAFKTEANATNEAKREAQKVAKEAAKEAAEEAAKKEAGKAAAEVEGKAIEAAQDAARRTARAYLRDKKTKLLEDLEKIEGGVKDVAKEIKEEMKKEQDEATDTIRVERKMAIEAADEAQRQILSARQDVDRIVHEAKEAIGGAQQEVSTANEVARQQIESARQDVDRVRNDAKEAIDKAQQEVDAAAESARQRIDRAAGEGPQGESE